MHPVGRMKTLVFVPKIPRILPGSTQLQINVILGGLALPMLMPGVFLQIRTADTWKFARVTVQWLLMWVLVLTVFVPVLVVIIWQVLAQVITRL